MEENEKGEQEIPNIEEEGTKDQQIAPEEGNLVESIVSNLMRSAKTLRGDQIESIAEKELTVEEPEIPSVVPIDEETPDPQPTEEIKIKSESERELSVDEPQINVPSEEEYVTPNQEESLVLPEEEEYITPNQEESSVLPEEEEYITPNQESPLVLPQEEERKVQLVEASEGPSSKNRNKNIEGSASKTMSEEPNEKPLNSSESENSEKEGEPSSEKAITTEKQEQSYTDLSKGDQEHQDWQNLADNPYIRGLKRFPGDKMVHVSAQAYASILLYASRYANEAIPRNQWKEVYGILIGKVEGDIIYVNKAEPMTVGHSVDVQLGPEHYVYIAQIQDEIERQKTGEFMVGWFHSHPGLSIFYSYTDLMNHLNFQTANQDFIGIVFDHTYIQTKPGHTGFQIFRMNDTEMTVESSNFDENYHEMRYLITGLYRPFVSKLLHWLVMQNTKGYPLKLSYGERKNPDSIPVRYLEGQEPKQAKEVSAEKIPIKVANRKKTKVGKKTSLSSIPGLKNKSSIPTGEKQKVQVKPQLQDSSEESEAAKIEDLDERGLYYMKQGRKYFHQNYPDTALNHFKRAFKCFRKNGATSAQNYLEGLKEIIQLALKEPRPKIAQEFADQLKEVAEEFGDLFFLGESHRLLGEVHLASKKEEFAVQEFNDAAVVFEKIDDKAGAGYSYYEIAELYSTEAELERAALFYLEAFKMLDQIKYIGDFHSKRQDIWAGFSNIKRIKNLIKEELEKIMKKVEDPQIREKIKNSGFL